MRASSERRFDAVIFDNDGLLLDTEDAWTRAERTLFERHGHRFTPSAKRAMIGVSAARAAVLLEQLLDLPGQGAALINELQGLALHEVGVAAPPRHGAVALTVCLREARFPLGLASNSNRDFVDRALARSSLRPDTFTAICAGDEVAHPKPAPDIYLAVCAALGVDPARTIALEDSPTGVAAAVAAGCYTIGVPSFEGVVLSQADLVVETLASEEILALVL
jgi:beta-phosphoglucomutase-like phosphatase (HAD superfamily)